MDKPISVGDLVFVAKVCCDRHLYGLGIPYTVASIGPRDDDVRTCSKCGASILGIVARNGNETPVKYAPIERLKRIPPLSELEHTEETIKETA